MTQVRSHRTKLDVVSLIVGGLLQLLLFALSFQLLLLREVIGTATSSSYAWEPLRSRETVTMLCVLVAGLVGGHLQYMRERFNDLVAQAPLPESGTSTGSAVYAPGVERSTSTSTTAPAPAPRIDPWFAFVSQLVMGLGAAGVAGLFVPLAIANRPALDVYNPWGLVILAAAAGYLSRHVFGGLQAKFERLFEELRLSGAGADAADVSSAAKQGVLEALGPPQAVNFNGTVRLDVLDEDGETRVQQDESGAYVGLSPSRSYTVQADFTPHKDNRGGERERDLASHVQPIQIRDGVDAVRVPFELRLELTFLPNAAAIEQSVNVVQNSIERVVFRFSTPEDLADFESPGSALPSSPRHTMARESLEIALFVYQNSIFCTVVTLPVRWTPVP